MGAEEAAELLGIPMVLLLRRVEDGRLVCHIVDGERRFDRQDVLRLKAVEDEQARLLRTIHEDLDGLDGGKTPEIPPGHRWSSDEEGVSEERRGVGRSAIPVEDLSEAELDMIAAAKIEGDDRYELADIPDVLVFSRPDGSPFEIPRAWWIEAGMDGFVRHGSRHRSDGSEEIVVRIADIVPARRDPGVVLDHGGFGRDRMVRALQGIARDEPIPPVKLRRTADGSGWKLHDGYHRYCASLAAGFEEIAAVETGRL